MTHRVLDQPPTTRLSAICKCVSTEESELLLDQRLTLSVLRRFRCSGIVFGVYDQGNEEASVLVGEPVATCKWEIILRC